MRVIFAIVYSLDTMNLHKKEFGPFRNHFIPLLFLNTIKFIKKNLPFRNYFIPLCLFSSRQLSVSAVCFFFYFAPILDNLFRLYAHPKTKSAKKMLQIVNDVISRRAKFESIFFFVTSVCRNES